MLKEPLNPVEARRLIQHILSQGEVTFSTHALDELAKDRLDIVDCRNTLRGGRVEPAELEHGSWRYRVFAPRMAVVVAFRSEQKLIVVTAWRMR